MPKDKFIRYFLKFASLSAEEIAAIKESMTIKQLKKGSYLLNEGQYQRDTYFILSGLVRQFTIVDGEDITTNLYSEEQWLINVSELGEAKPAIFSLVCMEDTVVVIGNETKAQQLFKSFPASESVSRSIVEKAFAQQQQKAIAFQTEKPAQRYANLLQEQPDIFQRVAQYHIASYIGVKPESLSRIRRQLQKKNL